MSLIARSKLSQLVVIDVQERLAGVMPSDEMQMVIKNCSILLQAAKLLEVPVIMTEQYPKGLGATVPKLLALLGSKRPVEKITFSCTNESKFTSNLTLDRSQIVLAGMEAHICVLQTALGFLEGTGREPHQVFIAEDAIISRNYKNKVNAVARMRDAGCIISNTESIAFEWLGVAQGDIFKQFSQLIR